MVRLFVFRLLEIFYRRPLLYLLPVLVALIGSIVYFLLVRGTYTAQGAMYIQRDSFLAELTDVNIDTGPIWTTPAKETSDEVNEMLQTDAFVRAVIGQSNLEAEMGADPSSVDKTIELVRENAWAAPIGSNQISINVTWEEPQVAVQVADGIIKNFLQWKENSKRSESEAALTFFKSVIQEYQSGLDQAREAKKTYLAAHPEPLRGDRPESEQMEIEQLQQEIDMASERLTGALNKEEDARLALAQVDSNTRHTYTIVDSPRIPQKGMTSRREKAIQASIFLVVGALLSALGLVTSILLDRSFYLPGDVEQKLGLPVLAVLPEGAREKHTRALDKQAVSTPQSRASGSGMAPASKLER